MKLRCLFLGRKGMTNLDSILKSRDITLPTKVCLVKAMVFPVVMYGCENWTIKKAECWRINAFELWCLRRLLTVLWTARRSNQSILKEISPGYSLEGLMLKLKLQYFGHLMLNTDSFEKTLMLGKIEVGGEGDDRGWGSWMASPTQWTWVWVNSGSWWWTGRPGVLHSMGSQRVRHDWATELNWAECNVLEVGKSKIRILAWYLGFLVRALFFICRWIPPYCVFLWCRETLLLHCVSYKGTNPIQKALPSRPAQHLVHVHAQSLLSFPALCNPMDCSPTGFSVYGILQTRILEWVVMPSSRESSWPRDRTQVSYVSCIGR